MDAKDQVKQLSVKLDIRRHTIFNKIAESINVELRTKVENLDISLQNKSYDEDAIVGNINGSIPVVDGVDYEKVDTVIKKFFADIKNPSDLMSILLKHGVFK